MVSYSCLTAVSGAQTRRGFRVVRQLGPIDALVYTAMIYEIAEAIEKNSIPNVGLTVAIANSKRSTSHVCSAQHKYQPQIRHEHDADLELSAWIFC